MSENGRCIEEGEYAYFGIYLLNPVVGWLTVRGEYAFLQTDAGHGPGVPVRDLQHHLMFGPYP
jgi:hypothetical protein